MSYANYGPVYETLTSNNQYAGGITIPITGAGAAIVPVELVRTVGNIPKRLVLGPGVWVVKAYAAIEPGAGGASVFQYGQGFLENSANGDVIATSYALCGGLANPANVGFGVGIDTFITVAPGATLSFRFVFNANGIDRAMVVQAGTPLITATKISN